MLGAKARALLQNRAHVTMGDIQALACPTLRHRVLLNYRAEAEGIRVKGLGRDGSEKVYEGEGLLARAWPLLATPASDRVFGLFFQVVGLASDGSEPYRSAVRALMMQWADWLEPRIVVPPGCTRRGAALAALARIDGLLLLRRTAGARAANQAVRAMTIGSSAR